MSQPSANELNLIHDPEIGLALLAKHEWPPERERERQFWQLQFEDWRDWLDGDTLAVPRALVDCSLFDRSPPFWLLKACSLLGMQGMSDAEKRSRGDMNRHYRRWKAVKLVRGQHPRDPRNYKQKVLGDAVWTEAAKLVAGTDVEADAETVRQSYMLIRHAGGYQTTLPSYKRAVQERDQPRQCRGKKSG